MTAETNLSIPNNATMHIEHMAIWVLDLEAMKGPLLDYSDVVPGPKYDECCHAFVPSPIYFG